MDLSGNKISLSDVKHISDHITKFNQFLVKLNLSNNKLGDEGTVIIS